MKYGESAFDLLYLITVISLGFLILKRARTRTERLMGSAALVLGFGDAFHLIPRVLNYFLEADLTAWLGFGKFVTSVTMTVFYVLMLAIGWEYYRVDGDRRTVRAITVLTVLRILLCLMPQNHWLRNESSVLWGTLRNLPFAALGALAILLYHRHHRTTGRFRWMWLYMLLSFLFYLPVAVLAGIWPLLGMLMIPKTVCYLLLVFTFFRAVTKDPAR